MKFKRRWLIAGTLTARTPLHIGSGEVVRRERLKNEKTGELVDIAGIAANSECRPFLPGSTLKGNLRAWAMESGLSAHIEALFGSEDPRKADAIGGKAEFLDAPAVTPEQPFQPTPPYWDPERLTGVTAATAINRSTKTVMDDRLFHQEFVPTGVAFDVRIGGQDEEGDSEDELLDLLAALEGFNERAVRLGSDTVNGWGVFDWNLMDVRLLDSDGVKAWLSAGATAVGYDPLQSVSRDALATYRQQARTRAAVTGSKASAELGVVLQFDSNFLVNDPSRAKTDQCDYDRAPLLDENGSVFLPARSFRGALRSQAEKILRTMGGQVCHLGNECEAVYQKAQVADLCLACQVFGAPGWRSPLHVTAFKPDANDAQAGGQEFPQEFVAIDRFKGGGADKLKFNAQSFYAPTLKGKIALDLAALQGTGAADWAIGLLALTLRDLLEGDITFGFGAGKGYGSCIAEIAYPGDFAARAKEQIKALTDKIAKQKSVAAGEKESNG